jgi:hypothetical protein
MLWPFCYCVVPAQINRLFVYPVEFEVCGPPPHNAVRLCVTVARVLFPEAMNQPVIQIGFSWLESRLCMIQVRRTGN